LKVLGVRPVPLETDAAARWIPVAGDLDQACWSQGWRIGWLVVPQALVRPMERLAQNLYISPPAISASRGTRGVRRD
jgi:hypothetical protein